MICRVTSKDKINFIDYVKDRKNTEFNDLFIVKNKKPIYLEDFKLIKKTFNDIVKRNFVSYMYDDSRIKGIILVSKDYGNDYVSVKADSFPIVNHLFKILTWNYNRKLNLILPHKNGMKFLPKKYKFIFQSRDKDFVYFTRKRNIRR